MVVAADDGVMPQTREHAAVLAALGIEHGVVAVTKADLARPRGGARGGGCSAPRRSERGGLRARGLGAGRAPGRAGRGGGAPTRPRSSSGRPRLHVDRSFTIRGAGTVVTGTLWSGAIARGDELAVLPGGRRVRVRGVQVHDEGVERAHAGQRVAVNLINVRREEVARGDVLVGRRDGLEPTFRIDVALAFPDPARRPGHGDRVTVHHGTRESPARIAELGGRFWQLRLEQPLVPAAGDRVVLRTIAPPDTLGGRRRARPGARRAMAPRATCSRGWRGSNGGRPSRAGARSAPARRSQRRRRPPSRPSARAGGAPSRRWRRAADRGRARRRRRVHLRALA